MPTLRLLVAALTLCLPGSSQEPQVELQQVDPPFPDTAVRIQQVFVAIEGSSAISQLLHVPSNVPFLLLLLLTVVLSRLLLQQQQVDGASFAEDCPPPVPVLLARAATAGDAGPWWSFPY
jgi:hypothetical protein